MRNILMVLLATIVTLGFANGSFAYELLGGKHKTTTLYLKTNSGFLNSDDEIGGALTWARGEWNAAGTPIKIYTTSSWDAQIKVNGDYYGNTGWSGRCTNYRDWAFAGNYSSSVIDANYTYLKSSNYNSTKNKGVFSHEIGHALGLDHETSTSVVMYSTDARTVYKPAADDIAGVNYLY
jgi:predicted Zn-dependent protease